jgi:hypothetical protein
MPREVLEAARHKPRKVLPSADMPIEIRAAYTPRKKPRPADYTYQAELGPKRRLTDIEATVAAILEIYPGATGEFVAGSHQQHRSYWFMGHLVAHTWPSRNLPGVWLRLRRIAQ